jgi:hypothetical protein
VKHRGPLITLVVALGALVLMLSLNDALIPNQASAPGPAPTATARPSGKPQAPAEAVFAGQDEDGKMSVAIAIKGGKAVGYLCDGRSIEAWLTGTVINGRVTLEAPIGDSTVYADVHGDSVAGVAVVEDYEFDFDIGRAKPPAGLYRKKNDKTTIGWIVLPDGKQVGVANTNGTKAPAPTLDPKAGDAEVVTGQTR